MIKLAGKITDKNRPTTVQHMKVANNDFVGLVKESYRLWITPDFRADNKALLEEGMLLILVIVLVYFMLHYPIKDTLMKVPEWMEDLKKTIGAF
jgi:hypothetical protein